ncbi:MAG TPA: class I SAM-dependent methyltransferase, partial [Terriglobales bacterium]|nr:class I SAM-dependent methyltransferase [Terriglobales bacterium]
MSLLGLLPRWYQARMKAAKLRNHLRPRRSWLVLDVGSGDGPAPAADVLCDRFVADDAERVAPLRLDRPFVSGDLEHLPFRDGAFDFVYCSHVLEHTADPARAIGELERVARAGYVEVPAEYLEKTAKSTPSHA